MENRLDPEQMTQEFEAIKRRALADFEKDLRTSTADRMADAMLIVVGTLIVTSLAMMGVLLWA